MNNPDHPDALLTSAQVSAMIGRVSQMTLWRWRRSEAVQFPRPDAVIGRRNFWREATVRRWLDRQIAQAAPASAPKSRAAA